MSRRKRPVAADMPHRVLVTGQQGVRETIALLVLNDADLELDEDQVFRMAGHVLGGGHVAVAAATEPLRDKALVLLREIARAGHTARTVN